MDELCRITKYEMGVDNQKEIYSQLTTKLTNLIYDNLFPLYTQAYRKKDAKLIGKCKELGHLTHIEIGINQKYVILKLIPILIYFNVKYLLVKEGYPF
jgi:hypothetical protein